LDEGSVIEEHPVAAANFVPKGGIPRRIPGTREESPLPTLKFPVRIDRKQDDLPAFVVVPASKIASWKLEKPCPSCSMWKMNDLWQSTLMGNPK
jgi:hypothetical protein